MPQKKEMNSLKNDYEPTQDKGIIGAIMLVCLLIGVTGCLIGIVIGYYLARHWT